MLIDDLIELQDFLSSEADIKQYCNDEFNEDCTVVLGFNDDKPEPESLTPFIQIIGNISQTIGKQKSPAVIFLTVQVRNESLANETNKKTHNGFVQVLKLAQMIGAKIFEKQLFKGLVQKIDISNERNVITPLHGANILIYLQEIYPTCEV